MIFNARGISQHPNCYLFYCPSKEACPMKPAKGLVSYRINRATRASPEIVLGVCYRPPGSDLDMDRDLFNVFKEVNTNGKCVIMGDFNFPDIDWRTSKSITSQMSELIDHIEEHLDKIELHIQFPEDQEKKHPETLDSFPKQKITKLLPTRAARTSQLSTSTPPPPAMLPTTISSAVLKNTNTSTQIPTSNAFTTTNHMSLNSRTATEFARLRTSATTIKPIATSTDSTSSIGLFSLSVVALLSKDSSAPFQNMHQDNRQRDSEAYLLDDVPKSKHAPQSGDKSGLVAALLFGIVFLLLVIVLIGRRMSQSLKRRRYNRLDYLINGMYADV
uniref:Endonuclease/exonuclease/phosphatase domain-containing protein n=1 Tax=Gopherus evgoodei TaxID=1825980 RepID=A0A8C4VEV2_9SAUR